MKQTFKKILMFAVLLTAFITAANAQCGSSEQKRHFKDLPSVTKANVWKHHINYYRRTGNWTPNQLGIIDEFLDAMRVDLYDEDADKSLMIDLAERIKDNFTQVQVEKVFSSLGEAESRGFSLVPIAYKPMPTPFLPDCSCSRESHPLCDSCSGYKGWDCNEVPFCGVAWIFYCNGNKCNRFVEFEDGS